MSVESSRPRLAVDIGGTFTDVALELGEALITAKVLTTPQAPEQGVLDGIALVMEQAAVEPAAVGLIIHGTTLATNAIIERKGARTALVVTEGLRDSVEMAQENRFEQYDIGIDRPEPLVPRYLRWPVRERMSASGEPLIALDETSVEALPARIEAEAVESLAIGLIHSYANPDHERRVAEILSSACPDVPITLSSEVCPEIREYERQSTACANAYVQPAMASYLTKLEAALRDRGFGCPFLLMTSGGGLTGYETAVRFPIRLVESGPAGGAILASRIARECGLDSVLSFDMGGTTAKICLIDDGAPLTSRSFEVDRVYRFQKGSGLPLRIPAIEMVEIGAGGGSIARVDGLGRVAVGPDSAGAEPGPACYGRGGEAPTVTDADLMLGRIDRERFADGRVALDAEAAETSLAGQVGAALSMEPELAAFAVSEMVDENMANAARVHAIEWGKDIGRRTLVAFGGAAPLHAARIADKLGLDRVVIPTGAGVGSAIGFLRAPVAYEVVRSRYQHLDDFDPAPINRALAEMRAEAEAIVAAAAPGEGLVETRTAAMRYIGQGHEIEVTLPNRELGPDDASGLQTSFDETYTAHYGRTIPDLGVEVLSWTLTLSTRLPDPETCPTPEGDSPADSEIRRPLFEPGAAGFAEAPVHAREALGGSHIVPGPALIAETQTTTVVGAGFEARINALGYIVMTRPRP